MALRLLALGCFFRMCRAGCGVLFLFENFIKTARSPNPIIVKITKKKSDVRNDIVAAGSTVFGGGWCGRRGWRVRNVAKSQRFSKTGPGRYANLVKFGGARGSVFLKHAKDT